MAAERLHAALCCVSPRRSAAPGASACRHWRRTEEFLVANPRYDALYQKTGTYYTKDPQWVSWTKAAADLAAGRREGAGTHA